MNTKEPLPISYPRDALPDEVKTIVEKCIESTNEKIWNEAQLGAISATVLLDLDNSDLHLMQHVEKLFRDAGYEVRHLGTRIFEVAW